MLTLRSCCLPMRQLLGAGNSQRRAGSSPSIAGPLWKLLVLMLSLVVVGVGLVSAVFAPAGSFSLISKLSFIFVSLPSCSSLPCLVVWFQICLCNCRILVSLACSFSVLEHSIATFVDNLHSCHIPLRFHESGVSCESKGAWSFSSWKNIRYCGFQSRIRLEELLELNDCLSLMEG
jgi:hypothetical protein